MDYLFRLFINMVTFNIKEEKIKLIQTINDSTLDFLKFANENIFQVDNLRMNFLWCVLMLTTKYPQVEPYLKDLLNCFTINELKINGDWSILHYMSERSSMVSLNSFEMVINRGINVNIKDMENYTVAHVLLQNNCDSHVNNILNLLINHGIDLNVKNMHCETILDFVTEYQNNLNEETKNCVMILVDYGATTNNPTKDNVIYDFVEYYKCSTIKLAIKK